jgi:cytochrome bd-type quinol oxidase subunit 1
VPPHGPTLAREFPLGIYLSVVGAYTWLLIAAWLFFGRSGWTDFELAFVSIILLILFGLPAIAIRVAWSRSEDKGKPWADFLFSTVDTATGPLSGGEAWLQILVIPLILALAATAIEIVDRLVT